MNHLYTNPHAREWRTTESADAIEFHRALPGYAQTRLVPLPALADELGVATVHVKEESARFGLPAFKMLGASYAVSRALSARHGVADRALGRDELRAAVAGDDVELLAATDGNHGRAVARMAALLGLRSRIFVPSAVGAAAKSAIADEASRLVELDLAYDAVVEEAASVAESLGRAGLLVQDTAWDGYADIPGWIVDGYATLFAEADAQLRESTGVSADLVAVPVGVGSLAQAAVRHYRSVDRAPSVLGVEPESAPAILESLRAGRPLTVPTGDTVMAGLCCGTPSSIAWPVLEAGLDSAVTVSDAAAVRAAGDLAALGADCGPCGAASLAGVRAVRSLRTLDPGSHVLLLSTEGRAANPVPPE